MSSWVLLARAGKRTKARKRKILGPIRALVEREDRDPLGGVNFASSTAERLATEAGLSWRDFANARCSGCAGFTAGDVRLIIGQKSSAALIKKMDVEEEFMEEEIDEDGREEAED